MTRNVTRNPVTRNVTRSPVTRNPVTRITIRDPTQNCLTGKLVTRIKYDSDFYDAESCDSDSTAQNPHCRTITAQGDENS